MQIETIKDLETFMRIKSICKIEIELVIHKNARHFVLRATPKSPDPRREVEPLRLVADTVDVALRTLARLYP